MEYKEIMEFLELKGSEQTRTIYRRHGARDPLYGVKISDLKIVLKKSGPNQVLAEKLWKSGNSDAMYLAGLMADPSTMSKDILQKWLKDAYWYMLSEVAVASVASESVHGWTLGQEWISQPDEMIASAGWSTLGGWVALRPDNELDQPKISQLLDTIGNTIHAQQNRVRYTMNNFVINVGVYVAPLSHQAQEVAAKIGVVKVNMGKTSCKVPVSLDYINKCIARNGVGKKRLKIRC